MSEQLPKVSPMMAQWHACKKEAKDAILFFRMGDFYEAFHDDAVLLAKELDITLTKRQETPMAGVPFHSCEGYIDRLVAKGFRVAVAEQIGDPKQSKGLVKREIVRHVTPGTVVNSTLLSDKSNNFFASMTQVGSILGLAFLDLTTSEFRVIEFEDPNELLNEMHRIRPSEYLVSRKFQEKHPQIFSDLKNSYQFLVTEHDDWHFDHQLTYDYLVNQLQVHNLDGFGLKGMVAGINAAGALLQYIQDHLCLPVGHIREIQTYSTSQYMALDRMTQRNLELTTSLQDGSRRNTLLGILDETHTPMGGRLMTRWVKQPLLDIHEIQKRQDAIQALLQQQQSLDTLLDPVRDIERLMMKISAGYATPRDLVALRFSMEPLPQMRAILQSLPSHMIQEEAQQLDGLPEMTNMIANAIVDDPPLRLTDGNIFRDGFHPELDELRELSRNGKSWIAKYQADMREQYGIKTLKVGFNRMFGYYIEVSKGQTGNVPEEFQRRQTLVNAERYITPELKEYETKVLTAEERISAIESELFQNLRQQISQYNIQVMRTAQALAKIDCLHSLAQVARTHDYARPEIGEGYTLQITDGRHPVIETANIGERFIPNDTQLDEENRMYLITGPNMAGKSTYIRQVALITIMAQIGCFVPAKAASIGVVDKVFTRIGASDDLSRGQSTFMVEMTETANILNNATSQSLVILDEIGRGTSTYDGISIAWSIAEHLLTKEGCVAKTLFATHYWELTKLEEKIPGAVNYNVAVHESDDHIVFLRKIVKGGTDKSYGIHVGRLAGLPLEVIERAKEILVHLEENANRKSAFEPSKPKPKARKKKEQVVENAVQLTFFE